MPFALVIIGLLMIVSGVRDTHREFGAQLKSDLTGDNNFLQYAGAIFAVGALGYINSLRGISTAFMTLILIALILSNRGVFARFQEAVNQGPEAPVTATGDAIKPQQIMPPGMTKPLDWRNLFDAPTISIFGRKIL